MKKAYIVLFIIAFTFVSFPAFSAPVHSNFGQPGDSFNTTGGGWLTLGDDLASPFTPVGSDYFLDKIEIAVKLESGTNFLDVWIMSDNSGSPGTIIETFNFTGEVPTSTAAIIWKDSISRPVLNAGNQFWIGLSTAGAPTNTSVNWALTDPPEPGTMAFWNLSGSGPWSIMPGTVSAFRISGTEVPVPPTVWLLGSGLIGLFGVRRKPKK